MPKKKKQEHKDDSFSTRLCPLCNKEYFLSDYSIFIQQERENNIIVCPVGHRLKSQAR